MPFKLTPIQTEANKLFRTAGKKEVLLIGGSRSGKSFVIVYYQLMLAQKHPGSRHLIARSCFNHAKNSIWLDTLKKVTRLCYPNEKFNWRHADHYLELENGSQLWIGGLDEKE